MNRNLKKFVYSEYRRLFALAAILIACLILSGVIFVLFGQAAKDLKFDLSYDKISKMTLLSIFMKNLKKNIYYFLIIIMLTITGQKKAIYILFGLVSIYYGLSAIISFNAAASDKAYFLMTLPDYFILFPMIFYFSYVSEVISKYTKKTKNIETISHKFDIIVTSYIKLSIVYLLIAATYSLGYSCFILIISRMLVK
jgi:hypothetical protein